MLVFINPKTLNVYDDDDVNFSVIKYFLNGSHAIPPSSGMVLVVLYNIWDIT